MGRKSFPLHGGQRERKREISREKFGDFLLLGDHPKLAKTAIFRRFLTKGIYRKAILSRSMRTAMMTHSDIYGLSLVAAVEPIVRMCSVARKSLAVSTDETSGRHSALV